ncbi:MAG: quinone oxidoreductase [Rhodospirillales bacterium]|nr:quinone oxidoreductase [Rhodospirillales bacterium]
MPKAIRIHETGGPEVLRWEDVDVRPPGPGEVRIRHTAVGVNYSDVLHRTGFYTYGGSLPMILGREGAGVVEAVGPGVEHQPRGVALKPGTRVAYGGEPGGSYCEARVIAADRVVALPAGIDDRIAAAVMLKGLTAQYLLRQTYRVKPGDAILVHAAAGGVGLLLSQWGNRLGALVIGTVGSEAKAGLARANGCDHVILYDREDVAKRVRAITKGEGVAAVYDSVGKATFTASLDSLAPRGIFVAYGEASGEPDRLRLMELRERGSLFLTRCTLGDYTKRAQDLAAMAEELFREIAAGHVRPLVQQTFPLRDAAEAHRQLESRATTGATVLIP